jgi:hypothetical protein
MLFKTILIFDWYDGPVEGVLAAESRGSAWYFKVFAERPESSIPNDRLFGLWVIPEPDATVLTEEFGASGQENVWPVDGGLGSLAARRIVDGLLLSGDRQPDLIVRSQDFSEPTEVWNVL